MTICKVIGHVWATKKEESLNGMKLMIVEEETRGNSPFVAIDAVGAGIGERVLVVSGSAARRAFREKEITADAAIVGIIDNVEIDEVEK